MNASPTITRMAVGAYILFFFALLFGPLVIMSITAFNSSSFPRVVPWECLTFEWFSKLAADTRVKEGFYYSLIIGALVVVLSLLLGLAGALMLTQVFQRARKPYYFIVTSPILMPGIVIGIATVLFWDKFARFLGLGYDSLFYNGIFLCVLGQSSFIASYCMLVFVSRLERFDQVQMEAALDLGASHLQAFRKILLPFLKPAIFSAAIIAFLASFENYNTSVFTLGSYSTFTVVIAQKVRLGLDPSISALAVLIITLTIWLALCNEAWSINAERKRTGRASLLSNGAVRFLVNNPAAVLVVIATAGILATIAYALTHDPKECKAEVLRRKLEIQQKYNQSLTPPPQPAQPAQGGTSTGGSSGAFGGVFNPNSLNQVAPTTQPPAPAPAAPAAPQPAPAPAPGSSSSGSSGVFGGVFAPGNLDAVVPTAPGPAPAAPAAPAQPAPAQPATPPQQNTNPFSSVFDPNALPKPSTSP
ncbi:MAG: ABC transporter permease subunit [Hyphomicrobiales bacterium]